MKANVTWQNNMVFVGNAASGFPVQMDSDSSYGGTNSGIRPMEMIALGLAGCTAMDVLSILQKKTPAGDSIRGKGRCTAFSRVSPGFYKSGDNVYGYRKERG